jgi:hypothetical protein
MRWDELFRDLEAQLEAAGSAELDAEVADRTRREAAGLALVDRARAAAGARVAARVLGAGPVEGVLREVGSEWLLLAEDGGGEVVLPLAALQSLRGLSRWTGAPGSGGQVFARLGLASALRGVARDRVAVSVCLVDGSVLTGTLDRVGADFVELSAHGAGEPRRRDDVTSVRTVPFAAIALVRSRT